MRPTSEAACVARRRVVESGSRLRDVPATAVHMQICEPYCWTDEIGGWQ